MLDDDDDDVNGDKNNGENDSSANNLSYLSSSTGMLERHVKRKHSELFKQALRTGAKKVPKIEVSQVSMDGFVVSCPTFEKCLLNWAVETYQPLRCCEERTFRDLCLALNKRCPILSRDKLHTMVQCQYIRVQEKVKKF